MTKRFHCGCCASASAETAAEASSSCTDRIAILLDAILLASFFVAVLAVRICVVALVALSLIILALLGGSRCAREDEPLGIMS